MVLIFTLFLAMGKCHRKAGDNLTPQLMKRKRPHGPRSEPQAFHPPQPWIPSPTLWRRPSPLAEAASTRSHNFPELAWWEMTRWGLQGPSFFLLTSQHCISHSSHHYDSEWMSGYFVLPQTELLESVFTPTVYNFPHFQIPLGCSSKTHPSRPRQIHKGPE